MSTAAARIFRNHPEAVVLTVIAVVFVALVVALALSSAAECPNGQTIIDYITIEVGDVDVATPVCG